MDYAKVRRLENSVLQNLRQAIAASGKTQEQVAWECEIGKGSLSEILAGKRNPSLTTLIKLSIGLGVPLSSLVK